MMTFLVVGDFRLNASLLDPVRLWKQVLEAKQLINAIERGTGWKHHRAAKSWSPYLLALKYYYNCVLVEFRNQGGTCELPYYDLPAVVMMPWWVNWDRLHQSHRAMLYRKDPFFYHDKFTIDPEFLQYGYIWPDTISYEQKDAPLASITAEIPPELINPVYCQATFKSGARIGHKCNGLVKPPSSGMKAAEKAYFLSTVRYTHPYCGKHRRTKSV